jgi:hypothetical protein
MDDAIAKEIEFDLKLRIKFMYTQGSRIIFKKLKSATKLISFFHFGATG